MSVFTDPVATRNFALAGRALLTLQSATTGKHFTYRVSRATDKETGQQQPPAAPLWFVTLLTEGSADDGEFKYLGIINAAHQFKLTLRSCASDDALSVKAFRFFWQHLEAGHLAPSLTVRHEGRCGRCGRTLTHPESIDRGIGPECLMKA